jgi:hypothetical protein
MVTLIVQPSCLGLARKPGRKIRLRTLLLRGSRREQDALIRQGRGLEGDGHLAVRILGESIDDVLREMKLPGAIITSSNLEATH